jgi:tetratricopeptide (TPR) repeat protein
MARCDPAMKRRRADQLLQTGKFGEALAVYEELSAAEPKDAKLHGLRARALFELHKADSNGLPRTVLEAVRKAHELDPDEANAFFVRGLMFKQTGESHKAVACWKRALLTDPKHLDAQREIRIAQMRK